MSLFDRYGIKEVADVMFYTIDEKNPGKPGQPVLYLDTLKVSTVEQTAEVSEARGGKGNTSLIAWDYGKEITVNLEDALFSQKSFEVMYDKKFKKTKAGGIVRTKYVTITEQVRVWNFAERLESGAWPNVLVLDEKYGVGPGHLMIDGKKIPGRPCLIDQKGERYEIYDILLVEEQEKVKAEGSPFGSNAPYYCLNPGTYLFEVETTLEGMEIDVSANAFPGTYYVTGDTFVRNENTGKDEVFQLVFPKVKVLSESNTLTMEAEGDPAVFNMSLKVLKNKGVPLMSLVKYELGKYSEQTVQSTGWAFNRTEVGTEGENWVTSPVMTLANNIVVNDVETYGVGGVSLKKPRMYTQISQEVPLNSPLRNVQLMNNSFGIGAKVYDISSTDQRIIAKEFSSTLVETDSNGAKVENSSSTYLAHTKKVEKNTPVAMLTFTQAQVDNPAEDLQEGIRELILAIWNVDVFKEENPRNGWLEEYTLGFFDTTGTDGKYHVAIHIGVVEKEGNLGDLAFDITFDTVWLLNTPEGWAWLTAKAVNVVLDLAFGKAIDMLSVTEDIVKIGLKLVASFGCSQLENNLKEELVIRYQEVTNNS